MPALRPSPKVMTLTEAAAQHVRDIMSRSERPVVGLRVGVKNGGCAGMEYTMEWADRQEKLDEVVDDKGVRIFIDRHGDGLPGGEAEVRVRLQQSQPNLGLRLR
jgi:iron-sulfur cluster assembly protein